MRKIEVDLSIVRFILKERKRINKAPLERLVFRDRATTFTPGIDEVTDWKFTGLNNLDFIDFNILRKKRRKAKP